MAVFGAKEHDAHVEHWARILVNPDSIVRTIELDGEVCGNMMSWSQEGKRFVGYWIDRAKWGRGVGTEALRLFVAELQMRPLYALVVITNIGSQRVLEKAGFIQIDRETSPEGGIEEFVYRLD
jgi:RimJ/RimL family protein N-acetyltransferase